jgi:hypothetical protein
MKEIANAYSPSRGLAGRGADYGGDAAAVAATYSHVRRIRRGDTGMARSFGAYRAAISSIGFADAIPVLACGSLEALTASDNRATVIQCLVPRYASEDVAATLERLYLLRRWFAHGADVPTMKEPEIRMRTLDQGLALVKQILRTAYADEALHKAALTGIRTVHRYLGP